MNAKHTPGPWHYLPWKIFYDPEPIPRYLVHAGATKSGIVGDQEFVAAITEDRDGSSEANARLIASAPELLAVLKRLQEAPCPDRYDKRWAEAEAATKKAEGRE